MDQLGTLEAEVMDRVWSRAGPATVRDILGELQRTRPLAYTTVMTVMDRLWRKGWLARQRVGRSYSYEATLSRGQYTAKLMTDMLATTDDRSMALLHFVETMEPAEYEALREALQWRLTHRDRESR